MIILALDIATSTGVAVGKVGSAPKCWSHDLGKGHSNEVRFGEIINLTKRMIEDFKPDLVAIEAPVGGPKTSHFLVGLWACAAGEAHRNNVTYRKYDVAPIRKHFIGRNPQVRDFPALSKAKAKLAMKQLVMDRCRAIGWTVPDHDAADAAALFDYAAAQNSRSYQMQNIPGLFARG